jgi:purine-binding chemotaxis protein CheW
MGTTMATMIAELSQLVAFTLDGQSYALHLESVKRIVRMVEVVALPKAPEIVLGVINLQGKIVPVLDIRGRFGLPKRQPQLADHLIVAQTAKRTVVIGVDSVSGVVEQRPQDITEAERIVPGLEYVQGVAKLQDDMLLIHDLDRFLSLDEEKQLEDALTRT